MFRFLARMRPVAAVLGAALLCPASAGAQTREELTRCRAIEDGARRLACYDAIQLSPAAPRGKYEPIALTELKQYALSYRGRLLEVVGWLRPSGSLFALGEGPDDPQPLPVDLRTMSRQEQDRILGQCGAGCEVTIQGRVSPVNFVTGIVADSVFVH